MATGMVKSLICIISTSVLDQVQAGDKCSACGTIYLFVGADHDTRFRSVVTSYDYDAPLSEAGDPTEKLLAIREVIKQVPLVELPPTMVAEPNYTCKSKI